MYWVWYEWPFCFWFLFSFKRGLNFFGNLPEKRNVTFTKPIGSIEWKKKKNPKQGCVCYLMVHLVSLSFSSNFFISQAKSLLSFYLLSQASHKFYCCYYSAIIFCVIEVLKVWFSSKFIVFCLPYWMIIINKQIGSPKNPSLLGLNVGGGVNVKLRLRRPNRDWDFFPFDQVLDTMLHELCHNAHGPHNASFYMLWDELRKVFLIFPFL